MIRDKVIFFLTAFSKENFFCTQSLPSSNRLCSPMMYSVSRPSTIVAPKSYMPKTLPVWPRFDNGRSSFLPQAYNL